MKLNKKEKNAVLVFIGCAVDIQFDICATDAAYQALVEQPVTLFEHDDGNFFVRIKLTGHRNSAMLLVNTPAIDVWLDFQDGEKRNDFSQIIRELWGVAMDSIDFHAGMKGVFRAMAGWELAKPSLDFEIRADNFTVTAYRDGTEIDLRLYFHGDEESNATVFIAEHNGINMHGLLQQILNRETCEAFDLLHTTAYYPQFKAYYSAS